MRAVSANLALKCPVVISGLLPTFPSATKQPPMKSEAEFSYRFLFLQRKRRRNGQNEGQQSDISHSSKIRSCADGSRVSRGRGLWVRENSPCWLFLCINERHVFEHIYVGKILCLHDCLWAQSLDWWFIILIHSVISSDATSNSWPAA